VDSVQTAHADLPNIVAALRDERPDPSDFIVSIYTHDWEPAETDIDLIRRERDFFSESGVQHVACALSRTDAQGWMRSVETLAKALEIEP
jgi:hypothetical protein